MFLYGVKSACNISSLFQLLSFCVLICVIALHFVLHLSKIKLLSKKHEGPSWSWSYGSLIYNYLVRSNPDQSEVYNIR